MAEKFKLTYATMFNPPEELHTKFDDAIAHQKNNLGREYGMIINGKDVFCEEKFTDHSPINTDWELAVMQKGDAGHARQAVNAAKEAFPKWSRMPWEERVTLLWRVADNIDERIYELSAVMALEVGKNRMESLGDVAETADLIRYACMQLEKNKGFVVEMGKDPLPGFNVSNISMLKPYGVWLIVSPFNFPTALTGGPLGAAVVAGNTAVVKPATDTPWIVRLLIECFRDAGLPDGVVNFVTGPGRTLGQALVDNPDIDGVTFTGSYDVGMGIYREFGKGRYVRPTILELGGKNPAIVSRNADLEYAAAGIIRSAFGLQGQKCSACSRVFVEEEIYGELVNRMVDLTNKINVGDPTKKEVWMGPVINNNSYQDFIKFSKELKEAGTVIAGGDIITNYGMEKGYFCAPTLVTDLPYDHRLWKQEMFVPITTVGKVTDLEQAMLLANDVDYGLTAGVYGLEEEVQWFFDHIKAGVTYANRPQGATTGAWPGFQPFGGWKGSGSSGKNAGGHYYLQLYMHEQIQTYVK